MELAVSIIFRVKDKTCYALKSDSVGKPYWTAGGLCLPHDYMRSIPMFDDYCESGELIETARLCVSYYDGGCGDYCMEVYRKTLISGEERNYIDWQHDEILEPQLLRDLQWLLNNREQCVTNSEYRLVSLTKPAWGF
ncbi:hypothetical protein BBP29_13090 [Alteromonas macleodii]|uniref:Uncharacterized protein n=1 Tax=Alteromonas mediterranea TaxID=314275 RepID=A0AAC8XP22_9ALTE|nr:hypothetical protein [Alteromonas sp. CNT1-28]AMJ80763.1 hypothetical protein AV942_20480 [Alteromonas mediterranea]AMJ84926.1 hypothetical protein AV941_20585 [Alteromonas mediterranea]OZC00331.1 hypothetical protein BBP29_13090 [Alteromonas macleodii]HBI77170.1 hypothetical protein [Alteromonas macleodii]